MAGGCSGPTPYNFSAAAADDNIVHGSARAGAKSTRSYSPDLRVTPAEVTEWVDFMKSHGIQRVISMLAADELATYAEPLPAALTAAFGEGKHVNVDPKADPEALPAAVIGALKAADEAGEKVVVHCWGGGGRTGVALAAWLVLKHKLSEQEAADTVAAFAKSQDASRRVDAAALSAFLQRAGAQ